MLVKLAKALLRPAVKLPAMLKLEPATTSVMPFGWLVRFSFAPVATPTTPVLFRLACWRCHRVG